jgi:tetratricopeptide (TPR) repeat protein
MDRARHEELFRQEFHTLVQLSHPNVVAVYDYGVDAGAPYYTMELLDGGDLHERVPVDWKTVCRVGRDICSALSLIHSRRMIYRDISPRNIRCTADGASKLLDFGALSPMGRTRLFVGTPSFAAPETVHLQPVDARTDLYSLGATLYFAITGRRAYPANTLPQLLAAFGTPPAPPSRLVPEVPRELDSLIMDLIQLDPFLRPASAAEVMDRLGAIAGLDRTEHVLVSRAYLSTPTLVGRDASIERFRRRLPVVWNGIGSALLVQGPRGAGRSRFLDACALEARITGATVIRADAADAVSGDYGIARALGAQLLEVAPDVARAAALPKLELLATLVPGLRSGEEGTRADAPDPPDPAALQAALREWLLAVAKERPLVVVVDDAQAIDFPSASLIALLAREAASNPLIVLASLPSEERRHRSKALELLDAQSRSVQLGPLSGHRTERLLQALFGGVANLQLAARSLHAISKGLPRDVMQLAQHLVDTGSVRYESGAWVLPNRFDEGVLPADMAHARRAKIDSLTSGARTIAQAMALAPDELYSFDECVMLGGDEDPAHVMRNLDELVRAELVLLSSKDYSLTGQGWREALRQSLDEAAASAFHARLARVFERRTGEDFRVAEHLLAAGENERGLDVLVHFSDVSHQQTSTSMEAFTRLVQSLPEHWLDVYDHALELCNVHGRSETDKLHLCIRVTGILSQLPNDGRKYFAPLLAQLRKDSGLDFYDAADPSMDPGARLQSSLGRAGARYAAPDHGGALFDPKTAIGLLGRAVAAAAGNVSSCLAVDLFNMLPSLAPFTPLAPALSAWQTLIDGLGARITAQVERAHAIYVTQLARLAAPDRAGLDETYQKTQELGIALVLGTIEAAMGRESSLERARMLESSPLHDVNAKRIRMLHYLWQGDLDGAERLRTEAEILTVERARRQTNEGAHLLRELLAHALAEDLMRVKRALVAMEPLAAGASGWRPALHWARAEYERIRGNLTKALDEVEAALRSMDPAGHPVWPNAAAVHVKILLGLDRLDEVRVRGEAYLIEASKRGIGYEQNYVRMPLAIALARQGARDEAIRHCETILETFESLGTRGMNIGLAHETRARVALELADKEAFARFAALTETHFKTGGSAALAAKYERLVRESKRREQIAGAAISPLDDGPSATESVVRLLETCNSQEERLLGALTLLLQSTRTTEGTLFGSDEGQLVVRARVGDEDLPHDVMAYVQKFWDDQCREDDMTAITDGTHSDHDCYRGEKGQYFPVLLSHVVGGVLALTGMALLFTSREIAFKPPGTLAVQVSRLVMGDQSAVLVAS